MKNLRLLAFALGFTLLTQCMTMPPPPAYSGAAAMSQGVPPVPPPLTERSRVAVFERPGLGTQLGREIQQDTTNTHFYRRHQNVPDATASFHYNDEEGAELMARLGGAKFKHGGSFDLVPGRLRVAVKSLSPWGPSFRHYDAGGRVIVIGQPDVNYQIVLTNLTRHRLEIVTSVDGLA